MDCSITPWGSLAMGLQNGLVFKLEFFVHGHNQVCYTCVPIFSCLYPVVSLASAPGGFLITAATSQSCFLAQNGSLSTITPSRDGEPETPVCYYTQFSMFRTERENRDSRVLCTSRIFCAS
ncbi:hypothetical protein MVEN_00079400 [Mycena venus]|uniref:Uncharacterized protein n=1 Tax=Mycena venus TaxID=2733690 RepID=A0A8H6Z9G9_9AGAR|nr:hypothetical protein MVEN_00079400 [Mycena venus]